jgi:cadmium resistance transport/sequestration family protein
MQQLGAAIVTGCTAFIATNLDDIVVLTLFFARVNRHLRPRHIVAGQYLGFTVLLLASLPGFLGGLVIPKAWIGLMGLLPIGIGLQQLRRSADDEAPQEENPLGGLESRLPPSQAKQHTLRERLLNPYIYQVAAVTIANGGDNLGIYVPLFAHQTGSQLAVIVLAFYLLVGVWCLLAARLTRRRAMARAMAQHGQTIVPFVLIGLGIFILIDGGTVAWLWSLRNFYRP